MAKLIDANADNEKVYVGFGIVKSEEDADGNLIVYGKATDGSVDTDQQIVDPEWSAKAMQGWLNDGGTLRVQHNPKLYPAGRGLEVETTPAGHFVKALVVEPTAKALVKNRVLRAFSVGIAHPVIERDLTGKARGGIIRGNERTTICELSLVDSPANKNCGFTLVKSEGVEADWEFGDLDGLLEKSVKTTLTKTDEGGSPEQPEDREDTEEAGEEAATNADTNPDDPDSDDPTGPASKAGAPELLWKTERHAWLQTEPKRGEAADGTEFLAKRAAWQRWWAHGEQAGLTDDGYPVWAAKRNMDPDVGGGVDRDKLPNEDFAGKDRSFPIVTPQDVADAARSIGRAGDDNFSADQLKANIIRIAKRKGAAFEAKLPDAWKGAQQDDTLDKAKAKGDGKAGPAVQCQDCNTYNKAGSTKCKKCGKPLGDDASEKKPAEKAGGKTCPDCGKVYHTDTKVKYCKKCGSKLPGMASKGALPADAKPAGMHREPDGTSTVEPLEHDAGMGTDPDPTPDKVPASVGEKAIGYAQLRAHDAMCAVYRADDVLDAYPSLKSLTDAIDPAYWYALAAANAQLGKADVANEMRELAEAATALKALDPELLADARAALHKTFASMYPTTSVKPGDDAVTPGKFNRPYITGGHAAMTATSMRSGNVPPSSHVPEPEQFDRGPLTAGQERPSPSNKAGNNPTASVATGAARGFYGPRAQDAARNALASLHDHIAHTYPNACPMAPSGQVLDAGMGATNTPKAVSALTTPKAPGEKNQTAEIVKALVTEQTSALRDEYETQITALRAEIDLLGSQPDPTQAPPRGAVRKSAVEGASPVEKAAADAQRAEKAAQERAAYVRYLTGLANSGDPVQRMNAERVLATYITS